MTLDDLRKLFASPRPVTHPADPLWAEVWKKRDLKQEHLGVWIDSEYKTDPTLFRGIRIHEGNPKKGDSEGCFVAVDPGRPGSDMTAVVSGRVDKTGVVYIDKVRLSE